MFDPTLFPTDIFPPTFKCGEDCHGELWGGGGCRYYCEPDHELGDA